MLLVRAIRKHRDPETGLLVGYTIIEEGTNNSMVVHKDKLKAAVRAGQCKVVNMTLTSDGRFIGKAAPAPKRKEVAAPKTSGMKIIQMFTCGRDILCAMIDNSEFIQRTGTAQAELKGMKPGTTFELGNIVLGGIPNKMYDNIVLDAEGKPDLKASGITKNSFSKIRDRLIKIVTDNNVESKLTVKKVDKDYFEVVLDNYEALANAGLQTVINIYKCLIIFAIKNGTKFRVKEIKDNSVVFTGPENVTEAKKVIKLVTAPATPTKKK